MSVQTTLVIGALKNAYAGMGIGPGGRFRMPATAGPGEVVGVGCGLLPPPPGDGAQPTKREPATRAAVTRTDATNARGDVRLAIRYQFLRVNRVLCYGTSAAAEPCRYTGRRTPGTNNVSITASPPPTPAPISTIRGPTSAASGPVSAIEIGIIQ